MSDTPDMPFQSFGAPIEGETHAFMADGIICAGVVLEDGRPAVMFTFTQGRHRQTHPIVLTALNGLGQLVADAIQTAKAHDGHPLGAPANTERLEAKCLGCGCSIFNDQAIIGYCQPCTPKIEDTTP